MAVQYAPRKLKVPPGFQNLLEGLAREVLREQPDDIIGFAARYFKNLLAIREEDGRDDVKKGDDMEKLYRGENLEPDPADPATAEAATKIQAAYRGHKTRAEVKDKRENEAATKIQSSYRGHRSREEIKSKTSLINAPSATGVVQEESSASETNNGETIEKQEYSDPKYTEAVVKIQAGYRGMKVREEVKTRKLSSSTMEVKTEVDEKERTGQTPPVAEVSTDLSETRSTESSKTLNPDGSSQTKLVNSSSQEEAATTIQAGFRGYKDRKKVQEMRQSLSGVSGDEDNRENNRAIDEITSASNESVTAETDEELDKAATKIQANFRGHKIRKEMSILTKQSLEEGGVEDVTETKDDDATE